MPLTFAIIMFQVEDQMKLLQNCWSELLILDFVFKQMSHSKLDQLKMVRPDNSPVNWCHCCYHPIKNE